MDQGIVIAAALVALVVLLAARTPVAFALLGAGALGLLLLDGPRVAMASLGREPFDAIAHYSLLVVPLYTAMGFLAKDAGLIERGFAALQHRLRRVRGSLALATLGAAAGFGAVSGSSVGTAAALGKMTMQQLPSHGYNRGFSAAVVSVTSSLGILIPPSIVLVLYGTLTGESIGELMIAALIPGLLTIVFYAVYILAIGWLRPGLVGAAGGRGRGRVPRESPPPSPPLSLRSEIWVLCELLILAAIVVGGIFFGLLTVTESAGLGAIVAALLLCWDRRALGARQIWRTFLSSMLETVKTTGMIAGLMIGAGIFATFVLRAQIPQQLSEWALSLSLPTVAIVAILLALLIPLGMFLDGMSLLLIMTPLLYTTITDLGYSGIWLAILLVKLIELGLVTPPVGLNVYVVSGVSRTPVGSIFKAVTPFFAIEFAVIVTLFLLPQITTWLPELMSR